MTNLREWTGHTNTHTHFNTHSLHFRTSTNVFLPSICLRVHRPAIVICGWGTCLSIAVSVVYVELVGLNQQLAQGHDATIFDSKASIENYLEYLNDGFRIEYPDGGPVIPVHVDIATRAMYWICFFLCLDFFRVFALDCNEQIRLLQVQSAVWIASQFERVCDRCTWNWKLEVLVVLTLECMHMHRGTQFLMSN